MRWAAAVLAVCLAACTPSFPSSPDQDRAYISSLKARTVQVSVSCGALAWSGTGVFIGGDLLATAAHVVEDTEDCSITVGSLGASVAAVDVENDAAVLRVGAAVWPKLCASEAYLGMPVTHVGYPRQLHLGQTSLQVSRGWLLSQYPDLWRVSSSFWSGSSGGPVFDQEGCLVGLAVAAYVDMLQQYPLDDQYLVTPGRNVWALVDTL